MEMKYNPVGWFEIPVKDMQRATQFYETVFGYTMNPQPKMEDLEMVWFPSVGEMGDTSAYGATGALVKHDMYEPSTKGSVVYFNANSGDLANELGKVEAAGGRVLKEKMSIGEHGFIGIFMDTEGNMVAMHSEK